MSISVYPSQLSTGFFCAIYLNTGSTGADLPLSRVIPSPSEPHSRVLLVPNQSFSLGFHPLFSSRICSYPILAYFPVLSRGQRQVWFALQLAHSCRTRSHAGLCDAASVPPVGDICCLAKTKKPPEHVMGPCRIGERHLQQEAYVHLASPLSFPPPAWASTSSRASHKLSGTDAM